ncbi:MAG TPA: hypothetical protein VNR67_07565, partial [Solirubrobacterales bacterium]|nr:hypothetical protein [Solirubrobacterales bacterium]
GGEVSALAGSLECPLQIVDGLDHFQRDLRLPPNLGSLNLRVHPPAKVLEVSLGPLRQLQVLIPLPFSFGKKGNDVLLKRLSRG